MPLYPFPEEKGFYGQDDKCEDENDFLEKSKKLIYEIRKGGSSAIEEIFFGESIEKDQLYQTLDRILVNIEEVLKIPFEKRTQDE